MPVQSITCPSFVDPTVVGPAAPGQYAVDGQMVASPGSLVIPLQALPSMWCQWTASPAGGVIELDANGYDFSVTFTADGGTGYFGLALRTGVYGGLEFFCASPGVGNYGGGMTVIAGATTHNLGAVPIGVSTTLSARHVGDVLEVSVNGVLAATLTASYATALDGATCGLDVYGGTRYPVTVTAMSFDTIAGDNTAAPDPYAPVASGGIGSRSTPIAGSGSEVSGQFFAGITRSSIDPTQVSYGSSRPVTLAGGQGVLPTFTVLGLVTATGLWVAHNPAASDGSEVAAGVLAYEVNTGSAEVVASVFTRGDFTLQALTFHASLTTDAAKLAQFPPAAAIGARVVRFGA